jgi:prepilin-type N-terminal cleavage/methylation domain-containing protein
MRRADNPHTRNDCRGFTLVEMAVVLVIVGFVTAMAVTSGYAVINTARLSATQQKMAAIDAALLAYRTSYDRLPCPGDLTLASSSANYGLEANAGTGSAKTVGSGVCTGGTPAANHTAAGLTNTGATAAEGAVPTVTLGLPNDFMYDGWGDRFRYAVDIAYTALGAFPNQPLTCPAIGAITVYDSSGSTARSTGAIYALISHGANGHGAYTPGGGSTMVNGGSQNANELVNCHCNSSATATTYAATYVQQDPGYQSSYSGNSAYYYDDIVTFKERWQMQVPWDAVATTSGNCYVYVGDYKEHRVEQYARSGAYVATIGTTGVPSGNNGQFNSPVGVSLDTNGSLWVADGDNGRVQKLTSSGSFLLSIGGTASACTTGCGCTGPATCPSTQGSGNGQLSFPTSVHTDTSGNVWVIDENNNYVAEYNSSGTWLQNIGGTSSACTNCSCTSGCPHSSSNGNGQLSSPYDLAIDSSGNIWVADYSNNRVVEYSKSGTWLQNIGGTAAACTNCSCTSGLCPSAGGHGNGQLDDPQTLTLDSSGNVWVTDSGNNRVVEYSKSGSYLGTFGPASGNGAFSWPAGIAFDGVGDVWVVNSGYHNISQYNSSGAWLLTIAGTAAACTSCGCTGPSACPTSSGTGNGQINGPGYIAVR